MTNRRFSPPLSKSAAFPRPLQPPRQFHEIHPHPPHPVHPGPGAGAPARAPGRRCHHQPPRLPKFLRRTGPVWRFKRRHQSRAGGGRGCPRHQQSANSIGRWRHDCCGQQHPFSRRQQSASSRRPGHAAAASATADGRPSVLQRPHRRGVHLAAGDSQRTPTTGRPTPARQSPGFPLTSRGEVFDPLNWPVDHRNKSRVHSAAWFWTLADLCWIGRIAPIRR